MDGRPRPMLVLPANVALRPVGDRVPAAPPPPLDRGLQNRTTLQQEVQSHSFISRAMSHAELLRDPNVAGEIERLGQALHQASIAAIVHEGNLGEGHALAFQARWAMQNGGQVPPPERVDVPRARFLLQCEKDLQNRTGVTDTNVWALTLEWPLHASQAMAMQLNTLDEATKRVARLEALVTSATTEVPQQSPGSPVPKSPAGGAPFRSAVSSPQSPLTAPPAAPRSDEPVNWADWKCPADIRPQTATAIETAAGGLALPSASSFSYVNVDSELAVLNSRAAAAQRRAVPLLLISIKSQTARISAGGSRFDLAQRLRTVGERAARLLSRHNAHLNPAQRAFLTSVRAAIDGAGPESPGESELQQQLACADAVVAAVSKMDEAACLNVGEEHSSLAARALVPATRGPAAAPGALGAAFPHGGSGSAVAIMITDPGQLHAELCALIRAGRTDAVSRLASDAATRGISLDTAAVSGSGASAGPATAMSPLRLAISLGKIDAVQALLAAGASLAHAAPDGTNPLHWAASKGGKAGLEAALALIVCLRTRSSSGSASGAPLSSDPFGAVSYGVQSPVGLAANAATSDARIALASCLLLLTGSDATMGGRQGQGAASIPGAGGAKQLAPLVTRFIRQDAAASASSATAGGESGAASSRDGRGPDLSSLVGSSSWSDVTLMVHPPPPVPGGKASVSTAPVSVPAHGMVLTLTSEFFAKALGNGRKQEAGKGSVWAEAASRTVAVHGCDVATVAATLRLMYTGHLGLPAGEVQAGLNVAELAEQWALPAAVLSDVQDWVVAQITRSSSPHSVAWEVYQYLCGFNGWVGLPAADEESVDVARLHEEAVAAAKRQLTSAASVPSAPTGSASTSSVFTGSGRLPRLHAGLAALILPHVDTLATQLGRSASYLAASVLASLLR